MDIENLRNFTAGWFIGDFTPSLHQTKDFEVGVKSFRAGEDHASHYHKVAKEINVILDGSVEVNGILLFKGDVFVMHPYEVTEIEFKTDTRILVIKTPSAPGDKYLVED